MITNEQIFNYITGKTTEEERVEIEHRLSSDEEFRKKVRVLLEGKDLNRIWSLYNSVDDDEALTSLRNKLYLQQVSYDDTTDRMRIGIRVAAAVVLFLIVAGTVLWYRDYTRIILPETPDHPIGTLVATDSGVPEVSNADNVCVAYHSPVNAEELAVFHLDSRTAETMLRAENITTYNNKEYWVTLPDGTSVHLNGNSRIIYPEHFAKVSPWNPHPMREVVLQGDAYFMVAKDNSRGFVVHTAHGDIYDYGTEFYVSTTKGTDESPMSVALIRGKVGVKTTNTEEKMLKPGEEAIIDANGVSVQTVDVSPYVAWNTGTVSFEGYTLEKIMEVISLWYDIEVQFENDSLRTKTFDGVLSRYEPLDNLLKSLNLVMSLKITHEGNIVNVRK